MTRLTGSGTSHRWRSSSQKQIAAAREAGRREQSELLEALCEMRAKADSHYHARRAFLEVRDYLRRALIDSPKAAVERKEQG